MDVSTLLKEYGPTYFPYLVFGCAVFENDITFVMAGIYVASIHHPLELWLAVACGVPGALIHDSIWFWLGHKNSGWLRGTSTWKRLGPQIESWAARFGARELFFCRFIPGTRNVSALFWGVHRMPAWLFYSIETAALSIWGSFLVWVGFKFGQQAEAFLGKVKQKHLGRWLLLALIITALVYFTVRAFTRHEIVKHGRPPEDPRAD
jgi:membrane protein DedA with SNARE-associated domain